MTDTNQSKNAEDMMGQLGNEFNIDDMDWDPYRRMAVLTFSHDSHGNVSAKYRGGMPVYRDRNSEGDILPGETWIVSLTLNPSTERNYFARAIRRLDASFMFELKKDQIDEIAKCLWETQRDKVEPVLLEKYAEAHREQVDKEVEEKTAKFNSEIEAANEKIAELEHKSVEDKQIIESLRKKLNFRNTAIPSARASAPAGDLIGITEDDIKVRRIGPDTITSEFFTKDHYSVHFAADLRMMIIVPDPEGKVFCMENIMTLAGLNTITPYGGTETEMLTKYSPEYGGIAVYLA